MTYSVSVMGIDIPCHICIRVSHQILQVLDCHSGIGRMPLPAGSCVMVLISKIFVLALSCPKNTVFISSLFADIVKFLSAVERV